MAKVSTPERAAELKQADIRVKGWLQAMFSAREALQQAVVGREYANFDGMIQGFNELPEGTSLEVAPQQRTSLEGHRYDTLLRHSTSNGNHYYSDRPFRGGALIIAKLEEVSREDIPDDHDSDQALIGLSFHCLRPGSLPVPRGLAVNQAMDGVFVPGELPFETTFRVVDAPPVPSDS